MTDFNDFYAATYADLTVQVHAYLGDLHEAQDVAQEAFCRALSRWGQISTYDDPAAWVRRVAWNLATSRWRRLRTIRAFHRRQRDEPVVDGPGPDRIALVRALATLPDAVVVAVAAAGVALATAHRRPAAGHEAPGVGADPHRHLPGGRQPGRYL